MAFGHTVGAVLAVPEAGSAESQLVESMRRVSINGISVQRTFWDGYFGSALLLSVLFVACAAQFLLLSIRRDDSAPEFRFTCGLWTAAFAAATAIAARHFVEPPFVVSALITASLGVATLVARRGQSS